MARVFRRPGSALSRRAPSRAARANSRKHKVIMESVTQEKKKLRSVISFEAKAPPGYTFIPAGNPKLTTACKEFCRKDGLKVFAVTTTPHMHTHNLSQHVHRIGYHFPSAVVAAVCMDMGLYLTAAGKAVPFHGGNSAENCKRANSEASQITINTEARDVLKDLFPNIPANDLNQIIKTAFQKGQRKVGTAVELPLARRAQLAVVAHIRHLYTDYDRLLKTTSFHEARSTVEEPTLARLVEWRGDDENGKTVLEDVFREVIVISDDEDSDAEGDLPPSLDRDYSVEVVSSHPRIDELQTNPVNYANPVHQESQLDLSDDDAPPGFRFVPGVPRNKRVDRRGFSRYQAWDRAMNRYRNIANGAGATGPRRLNDGSADHSVSHCAVRQPLLEANHLELETAPHRPLVPRNRQNARPVTPNPRPRINGTHSLVPSPTLDRRVSPQSSPATRMMQLHPMTSAGTDDLLTFPEPYELYPVTQPSRQTLIARLAGGGSTDHGPTSHHERGTFYRGSSPNAPVFVSGPREIGDQPRDRLGPLRSSGHLLSQPNLNPQDRVLPSIETPPPTDGRRPDTGPLDHLAHRMSGGFSIRSETPHRLPPKKSPLQAYEDNTRGQVPKRRRVAFYEPSKPYGIHSDVNLHAAVESDTGERHIPPGYLPAGHLSTQDEPHIRRRYVPPANPRYSTNAHPEALQDSFLDVSRANANPGIVLHPRRPEGLDRHPISRGRLPAVRESPGQPWELADMGPALAAEKSHKRVIPVRSLGQGENRIYNPGHPYHADGIRPSDVPMSHQPSFRTRANHFALHEGLQRRHYADDFVRTIDLHDPIPLEYAPQRPLQPANPVELPSPPTLARLDEDQYGPHVSGSMAAGLAGQTHSGHLLKSGTHDYAVVEDGGSGYHGSRPIEPRTAARHYDGGYDGPINHRQNYEQYIQSYPTYAGGNERSQPHYSVPKGQAVVIVD
ncbi:hypothetical protein P170DRAFT_441507 [Aspergillus steynii IBT 23096]|uniref:DUF2293 domain-containing protein n=1 Tax=Aspergillus steynii IBT 23096 TaxID=1392250 RepID=A0A2I2FTY2_9EURO|nr:uncharacterized protein P170DRAFT_441507 [Aspergillus steynii IBT 23096]PLB44061.1 hypothetical protein P170DRAFT_441507 [Aspergillus steynii IBT 23096]